VDLNNKFSESYLVNLISDFSLQLQLGFQKKNFNPSKQQKQQVRLFADPEGTALKLEFIFSRSFKETLTWVTLLGREVCTCLLAYM
jgi:hypothetical protein